MEAPMILLLALWLDFVAPGAGVAGAGLGGFSGMGSILVFWSGV
jgi:hypothetical protein